MNSLHWEPIFRVLSSSLCPPIGQFFKIVEIFLLLENVYLGNSSFIKIWQDGGWLTLRCVHITVHIRLNTASNNTCCGLTCWENRNKLVLIIFFQLSFRFFMIKRKKNMITRTGCKYNIMRRWGNGFFCTITLRKFVAPRPLFW